MVASNYTSSICSAFFGFVSGLKKELRNSRIDSILTAGPSLIRRCISAQRRVNSGIRTLSEGVNVNRSAITSI
jgi:hypothetical protein